LNIVEKSLFCTSQGSAANDCKSYIFLLVLSFSRMLCTKHYYNRLFFSWSYSKKQAVREAARYAPAPVRRTLQPSFSPYTSYACGAQSALRHEYSLSTGSGSLWLWFWCRPYKVCSDLNSQPKRTLTWSWKWCPSHVRRGLPLCQF